MKSNVFKNFEEFSFSNLNSIRGGVGGVGGDTGTTEEPTYTFTATSWSSYFYDPETNDGTHGDWTDKDACQR